MALEKYPRMIKNLIVATHAIRIVFFAGRGVTQRPWWADLGTPPARDGPCLFCSLRDHSGLETLLSRSFANRFNTG